MPKVRKLPLQRHHLEGEPVPLGRRAGRRSRGCRSPAAAARWRTGSPSIGDGQLVSPPVITAAKLSCSGCRQAARSAAGSSAFQPVRVRTTWPVVAGIGSDSVQRTLRSGIPAAARLSSISSSRSRRMARASRKKRARVGVSTGSGPSSSARSSARNSGCSASASAARAGPGSPRADRPSAWPRWSRYQTAASPPLPSSSSSSVGNSSVQTRTAVQPVSTATGRPSWRTASPVRPIEGDAVPASASTASVWSAGAGAGGGSGMAGSGAGRRTAPVVPA